jgi:adenylate cyclase
MDVKISRKSDHLRSCILLVRQTPSGISTQAQYIPEGFHEIIGKCLAKEADARYQHVDEIVAHLRGIQRNLRDESIKKKKRKGSSIAVLPLENMNRDEESEFFSDGIAEDITTALSKIEALRVASRNSAFQYKNKIPNLRDVGKELNVNTVLAGSLRRVGNKIRITVRLNNVFDGYEIWSERYDRVLEDIFEIQDEISEAVVEALKIELVGDEEQKLKKRYTDNVKAYNHYLKGRYYWNTRIPDNIKKALTYFERALDEDQNYALAHSGKADCYGSLGILGGVSPEEVLKEGIESAQMAINLDPNLAEAHTSLAFIEVVYNWKWEFADQKLLLAQKLDPNYATAPFWRAIFVLSGTGRYEESVEEARKAREKQPTTAFIDHGMAFTELFGGQFDKAILEARRTLELDPTYLYAHWTLGRAYLQKGEYEKALEEFSRFEGSTFKKGSIGYAYAVSGDEKRAHHILEELKNSDKPDYVKAWQIALIYSGLEDIDNAFDWLNRAYEVHSPLMVWINGTPEFKQLHNDSRWKELLKRMKLIKA